VHALFALVGHGQILAPMRLDGLQYYKYPAQTWGHSKPRSPS
jgi:hypothetical protein